MRLRATVSEPGIDQEVFFEMSSDMLLVAGLDGVITRANPAIERLLGIDPLSLVGRALPSVVVAEDQAVAEDLVAKLARGGEADALLQMQHVDGEVRCLRCIGRGIPILSALFVSARDVTDQNLLSADLQRSNRDLEQFAYLASHDLQAPLRTVRGFNDLLISRIQENGGVMDDEARRYAAMVDAAVDRMEKLIRGLLAFSRVENHPVGNIPVDLQALCDLVVTSLAASIDEAHGTVSTERLPKVLGDPDQLSSVLQNLIQNAVKYRHPDRPPAISVSSIRDDGRWIITVRDNGIGIDPRLCERAFQMFKQLHPEGTYEGIGLGLSLARRIVENHGGSMWLDSDGESGTAATFTIPVEHHGDAP